MKSTRPLKALNKIEIHIDQATGVDTYLLVELLTVQSQFNSHVNDLQKKGMM